MTRRIVYGSVHNIKSMHIHVSRPPFFMTDIGDFIKEVTLSQVKSLLTSEFFFITLDRISSS